MTDVADPGTTRAGFVALAGLPNAGKSTLLNALLGRKLSITAPKPQTTRNRIVAVAAHGDSQLVFVDTPGIHHARGLMHRRMVEQARSSLGEADVSCWLIAADKGIRRPDREQLAALADKSTVIVLNKIDRVSKPSLLPIMAEIAEINPNAQCLPVSALRRQGIDDLTAVLADLVPEGPWLYPSDVLTELPARFFVAELVREQLFRRLREEMPYRLAVVVDRFQERGGRTRIQATIYTDSPSSKKIIVGAGGEGVKTVGIEARRGCERFLETRVDLFLDVKVRKAWQEDERFLAELGI